MSFVLLFVSWNAIGQDTAKRRRIHASGSSDVTFTPFFATVFSVYNQTLNQLSLLAESIGSPQARRSPLADSLGSETTQTSPDQIAGESVVPDSQKTQICLSL